MLSSSSAVRLKCKQKLGPFFLIMKLFPFSNLNKKRIWNINKVKLTSKTCFTNYPEHGTVSDPMNTKKNTYSGLSDIWQVHSQKCYPRWGRQQISWRLTTLRRNYGRGDEKIRKVTNLQLEPQNIKLSTEVKDKGQSMEDPNQIKGKEADKNVPLKRLSRRIYYAAMPFLTSFRTKIKKILTYTQIQIKAT